MMVNVNLSNQYSDHFIIVYIKRKVKQVPSPSFILFFYFFNQFLIIVPYAFKSIKLTKSILIYNLKLNLDKKKDSSLNVFLLC